MTIPRFSAEAALYKTQGGYRTARHRQEINSAAQTDGPVYAAMRAEETIHVHSCAPGWTEVGGECWPDPLSEPSWGSPFDTGGGSGSGGGSGGGGGGGGSGQPPKPPKPPKCECGAPSCAKSDGDPCRLKNSGTTKDPVYSCVGSCYNSEGVDCGCVEVGT